MNTITTRLVLIDNGSGFVWQDTAAGNSDYDPKTHAGRSDESHALEFARHVDQKLGAPSRDYAFSSSSPRDSSTGYHVYDLTGVDGTVWAIDDGMDQEAIDRVTRYGRYVGYVRCE